MLEIILKIWTSIFLRRKCRACQTRLINTRRFDGWLTLGYCKNCEQLRVIEEKVFLGNLMEKVYRR